MDYCLILLLLGLLGLRRYHCLFVTDMSVPQIVDFRDNVTLSCSYNISGHTLNSVKWYKDNNEFFRYSPLMHPVYMTFPIDGIQQNIDRNYCNESTCSVELSLLSGKSTGIYRCEVSGDAPSFKLTARTAKMRVESLPQSNPMINNFQATYRHDDYVHVNCTTAFASLPAHLNWYINGELASASDLLTRSETTLQAHDYDLHRQSLQLSFYVNDQRFQFSSPYAYNSQLSSSNGKNKLTKSKSRSGAGYNGGGGIAMGHVLELRCIAEIENFPQLRRETVVHAKLLHSEQDLHNQKLVNSVTAIKMQTKSIYTYGTLLTAFITLSAYICTHLMRTEMLMAATTLLCHR